MAQYYNLAIDQGTDFTVTITAKDNSGSIRDLTNYSGRAQLRRSFFSSTNVEFTVSISSPANGEVVLTLPNAKTANLKYGRYVYDVELQNTISNAVERLQEGIAVVYPQVTR